MIRVTLIAPYMAVQPVIEEVLSKYTPPEPINPTILVMTAEQLSGASLNCDVVISRGFTAELVQKQFPEVLSVPMRVSGYDVINAFHTAMLQYSPHRIALVGSRSMVYAAESLDGIFGIEAKSYQVPDSGSLTGVLQQALKEGCDCFIGGLAVMDICRGNYPCVLVETGQSAIMTSLEEAVRLVINTRAQVERSLRYKAILDYSRDGMVSLNENGRITSISQAAQGFLGLRDGSAQIGRLYKDCMPFAEKSLPEVYAKGKKVENEVYSVSGQLLTVDYIPTVRQQHVTSVVVFIRSVNRIQQEEALIRKKMPGHLQQAKYHFEDIIYRSREFSATVEVARIYARTDSPVLIMGESGTGKELIAQSIHNESPRKEGPFIAVNCAALTESLLESELFGYSDGAFTGALKGGKEGLFEAAHGGTIFLDEISEIPVSFQSKLLRVLQEGEVRRIGVNRVVSIDVRVIAATNRDLRVQVQNGLFRRDLLFRLNVLNLYVPPLRSRKEDIAALFSFYVKEYAEKYKKNITMITSDAKELLETYPWEGNVRELKNIAERTCVLNQGDRIDAALVRTSLFEDQLPALPGLDGPGGLQEASSEDELIRMLLQRYGGNKTRVAQHMGIDRSTLWRKLKKYQMI